MGFAVIIIKPSGKCWMLSDGEERAPGWVVETERSIPSIVLSGPSGPGLEETAIIALQVKDSKGLEGVA